ncbi:hypothetical protein QO010_001121 [Caulobacter ginsengisoli]|uniref:Uncharacterized protein n=1 Tax=Caulobacter ginsengisoli TaxID=400775 RepID=A0ABU0IPJ9_9CAUL|nr:hypothetical protein [Caulobacter ginsengisoli]MDQ0463350.1 hypothetical protein [Caulobacter ginsengisoli]
MGGGRGSLTKHNKIKAAWLAMQTAALEGLNGHTVTAWSGIELAFDERAAGHVWSDPGVPMLQLSYLHAATSAGGFGLATAEDDDTWGLYLLEAGEEDTEEFDADATSRRRDLTELPTGRISGLQIEMDGDNIAAVTFEVDGASLSLRAGKVQAEGGAFTLHPMDEAILVQVNGALPAS